MKKQTINYLGHKWFINHKSKLGSMYIELTRTNFLSDLRKYGQVATVIDAPKVILTYKFLNYDKKR